MLSALKLEKFNSSEVIKSELNDIYKIFILDSLFASEMRLNLVLKGLTAAQLAYGIGDGDNRIELITLKEIKPSVFLSDLKKVIKKFKNISIDRITDKRYTYSVDLIIDDGEAFQSKLHVQITKIQYNWKRKLNYDVRILELPDWTVKVCAQVSSLQEIVNDHPENELLKKLKIGL